MAAPVLSSFAQRLYDSMQPLAANDASYGYPLANFCAALGSMFQIVDDYGRDQLVNGKVAPGWSQLLDINRAPTAALQWLAQFVGVQLTIGLSDANQRLQILNVGGWNRGTPAAFIAAAQATLTGTKQVTVYERNGDPYYVTVSTKTSETPNPTATLAALLTQKPAGIILNYQNIDGQTYNELFTGKASYSAAFTAYSNYQNLLYNNTTLTPPPTQTARFGDATFGNGDFGGV